MILDPPGAVGWGHNGGFQAINLAIQFGARIIVLVGFDMSLTHGVHWHGRHPAGLNNPKVSNVDLWRKVLDDQAQTLHDMGVTVLNASPISNLEAYPKVSFEEALAYVRS